MPRETQNYIPSLMAIIFISKNPENYGFTVNPDDKLNWEIKKIDKSVKLEDIAKCSGFDIKLLQQYNPETGIGVFEPTHGSAPKYADYETSIVNPIAMIETSCMMLDFIDEQNIANKIRKAVSEVIQEGNVQTYDMAKMTGKADVIEKGAASTTEMANAIISKL